VSRNEFTILMKSQSDPLKKPLPLAPGDTIGIVAPASPFNRTNFNKGLTILRSLGFKIRLPNEIFQSKGYLAGSNKSRANQLTRLIVDSKVKGIIGARGGFGAMKLLPLLDFDYLRSFAKVFIGFSDITALLASFVEKCRWVVFHGPNVTTLINADSKSLEIFRQVVSGRVPLTIFASKGNVLFPGAVTGPLMAGNLTTLCHLLGTPYMPNLNGSILLVEDRGEATYRVDRMLTQMKMAGSFDQLAGLALGDFTDCGTISEVESIVAEIFCDRKIPILSGFEVGHSHRNLTLPLGLNATLDTQKQMLSLQSCATDS
jgi:muramoyltetrapeptide carboxypeptidase